VKNIHAYTKRAFQCQQNVAGKSLIVAHQLAFDFMGLEQNAYSLYFAGTTEQSCFETACQNKQTVICRYICLKRKVRGVDCTLVQCDCYFISHNTGIL
jgi:hypothetical protein